MRKLIVLVAALVSAACGGSGGATATPPLAAAPTFSPAGNTTYGGPQSVTLASTTPGAAIHYTLDGSIPTGGSNLYSTPIPVSVTTTIKAFTSANGSTPSPVVLATYTIGSGGADLLTICNALFTRYRELFVSCEKSNPAILTAAGSNTSSGTSCADWDRERALGYITFDATMGAACTAATPGLTCAALVREKGVTPPPSCTAAIVGMQATGQSCYSSKACASGFCSSDYSQTCPGTCQPFVAVSGDCMYGTCAPGLACDKSVVPEICKTVGSVGEACPCMDGLWCNRAGGTPVCANPGGAGASCPPYGSIACAIGNSCVGYPVAYCYATVGSGASCGSAAPCGPGYDCAGTGRCTGWPTVGQSCAVIPNCVGGYCASVGQPPAMTCVAYKANGAACSAWPECASQDCVNGFCIASTCAPP